MSEINLLLVDDEPQLVRALRPALAAAGAPGGLRGDDEIRRSVGRDPI